MRDWQQRSVPGLVWAIVTILLTRRTSSEAIADSFWETKFKNIQVARM